MLSDDQLQILSKGLKFVTTPINTFVTKWKKPTKQNISKQEHKILKELKQNENIIVVPADKGGKTVVMGRKEYLTKMEDKFKDITLYEVVKDPTNFLKKKMNALSTRLFKENKISEYQRYNFSEVDNLPYVRGQPKIHKNGNPMRIVTCTRSTITSNISQFTFAIIKQLRENIENCVTNTKELLNQLSNVKLDDEDRLISLDMQDLFTNVDVNIAIDLVIKRIGQSEKFCESSLSVDDLRELLKLCLDNSYFTFNEKYYRQKRGLPMGNLLSPLISDIFMDDYIKSNIELDKKERLWRYVDDILMVTKMNEFQLQAFVDELNAL